MSTSFPPGLHPFWFWNCPLDATAIKAQVAALAAGGCRGVFIHPRQGMQVPYLSQAFFDLIATAIDACEAHGIVPHIYDEFPYPSGMAGGQTCMGHPEHMATRLQHHELEHEGGALRWDLPAGEILSCQAVPLQDDGPCWQEARDLRHLAGSVYSNETWFQGGLSTYTEQRYFTHDPVMQVAGELPAGRWLLLADLQCVVRHHKYWNEYADVCDPAAMHRFMELTHHAYARQLGPERMAKLGCCFIDEVHPGWSRRFPAVYRERYGEDLEPLLPALQRNDHPRHRELKQRFAQLQFDCFVEAFEQPLADWCREHGLLYVAEKPLLRIEQLRYVDIPGCDAGHRRVGVRHDLLSADLRHNVRATASAAQLYGKEGAACEAFHSLGWSATLEDARLLIDLLLLHGIDRIVPHAAFASINGLRKHDAPPAWSQQRPDWPLFGKLAERIDAISAQLAPLHHDADLLVIDPALPRHGAASDAYENLLHELSASRREFLIVDRAWLQEHDATAGVIPHAARDIDCLIAPAACDDSELESWLQAFAAAGGTVLRQSLPSDDSLPGLRVLEGQHTDLHQARFLCAGEQRFLAVNAGRDALRLQLPAGYATTDIGDAPLTSEGDALSLPGLSSVVLCKTQAAAQPALLTPVWPSSWSCRALRPNLLRLNDWQLSVEQDGQLRGKCQATPKPIGDQLAAGGIPIAYRRQARFGQTAILSLPTLDLVYRCQLRIDDPLDPLLLVIEDSSLQARDWWIDIAGQHYDANDFKTCDAHIEGALGLGLPALAVGSVEIALHMRIDRDEHGLLAPIYLGGNCACTTGPALSAPRQQAPWADLDAAGLCYYAGAIDWEGEIDIHLPDDEHIDLDLPALGDDSYQVAFNDGPWQAVPWSPRRLRLERKHLRQGSNRCRIRQYTSLGRALDGERWHAEEHRREALP